MAQIKCVNGECCSQVLGHPGEQCGTTTRESEWRAAVSSMRRLARAMTGKFNPNTFWLLSRSHIGWTPWKVGRWGSAPQRPSFVTEVQTIPTCLWVCTSLPGSLASKYTLTAVLVTTFLQPMCTRSRPSLLLETHLTGRRSRCTLHTDSKGRPESGWSKRTIRRK